MKSLGLKGVSIILHVIKNSQFCSSGKAKIYIDQTKKGVLDPVSQLGMGGSDFVKFHFKGDLTMKPGILLIVSDISGLPEPVQLALKVIKLEGTIQDKDVQIQSLTDTVMNLKNDCERMKKDHEFEFLKLKKDHSFLKVCHFSCLS